MVTSLANFRSDYAVVHIPDGNFPAHREQLYVNINLMRMGCSGRSALTLQEPRYVNVRDKLVSNALKQAILLVTLRRIDS